MSLQSKRSLLKKLDNKQYRDTFVGSKIGQTIAFQLRVMRQRAGLSQDELAKALGTSQNAVSRMENPRYGKPSITTLKKVASFFDVGLVVRFAPLSEIVEWTTKLSTESIQVPDFCNDAGLADCGPPTADLPDTEHKATQCGILTSKVDTKASNLGSSKVASLGSNSSAAGASISIIPRTGSSVSSAYL